jgi:hypothetical protein
LFMRPMGRRVADTGPCSRDSVAHLRVSKEVTPRIVRTHRSRSFVMKRRGGIVLVSDFTAERDGAHQHRRCSRRRGRCASRRASDARRGSPKPHSRLPATPGPRAGVRRQRSAVLVGPGGWVHAIGDAPPARVGDSRSARVRTSAPILASSTASTSPTAGGGSLSRLAVRRRPLTAICSNRPVAQTLNALEHSLLGHGVA